MTAKMRRRTLLNQATVLPANMVPLQANTASLLKGNTVSRHQANMVNHLKANTANLASLRKDMDSSLAATLRNKATVNSPSKGMGSARRSRAGIRLSREDIRHSRVDMGSSILQDHSRRKAKERWYSRYRDVTIQHYFRSCRYF